MTIHTVLMSTTLVWAALSVSSQPESTARWTELQRHALEDIGREGVEMLIEIPAGVSSARHSHPGDDFGYVIDGTIVLQVDGKPPLTVKAGEAFFTARGHVHNARNIGSRPARVVDTYIIDTGQPVVIPR